ncbi:MAG: FtsQ-type POTRA domain-containing protein [Pseudonocardiaceae bacterium]|nr:FtsQ-type POTRA domain-containing protein [Pseudonocardiaceae bacterium]
MSATQRPARRQPHRPARRRPRRGAGDPTPPRSAAARRGRATRSQGSPADRVARGRRRRRVAIAVVALAGVGGVLWLLLGSSLFAARQVAVEGTVELSSQQVGTAAQVPIGTPLLLLDTATIESRVQQLRRVATVEVSRSMTGTVRITVSERTPVAVAPSGEGVALVDATATSFATVPEVPRGLPELRVSRVSPEVPAARAAVQVLTELPPGLRERVKVVSARSSADVVLRLGDDREVHWGGPSQSARKTAVLGPLLSRPGDVYDVSSPQLPTIS